MRKEIRVSREPEALFSGLDRESALQQPAPFVRTDHEQARTGMTPRCGRVPAEGLKNRKMNGGIDGRVNGGGLRAWFGQFFPTLIMTLALGGWPALASAFDHGAWDALLRRHVVVLEGGQATQVDYAGMAADRSTLQGYLEALQGVGQAQFDTWPAERQLAFLINAYNAWTVELILGSYPGLQSIKDLGSLFRSPWKKNFIALLGETRSLDDIEHGLIRGSGRYDDPRIHFAVNCASIGCPALRAEAFVEERLDAQLAEQTRLFLADRSRNRLRGGSLEVSSIFKWYGEDFEKGWRGYRSLPEFFTAPEQALALGLAPVDVERLRSGAVEIDYLDYDWGLNAK